MRTPLRVLILEDRVSDAELMVYELRRAGFAPEWRWVKTEEEFLEHLGGSHDIVLADYNLPGYDALRAIDALKGRGLEIPIIVVTGTVGEEVAVECIKRGADDYLLKDRMARLGPAVRQAMRNRELCEERRRSEARILHLNKVLEAVREINQLIIRERNPARLLSDACAVLVGTRGYRMVWMGLAELGSNRVVPAAWAGEGADFLEEAGIALDADEFGGTPISTAIRQGRPDVCQDIATDPRMIPWKQSALSRGFASALAAPIRYENRVFGALVGYKDAAHAFDEEEILLLSELAGDIGFALQNIEDRDRRKQAEESLRAGEERYRALVEKVPGAIYTAGYDEPYPILYISPQVVSMFGYLPEEWTRTPEFRFRLIHPDDLASVQDRFRKILTGEPALLEYRLAAKGDRFVWIRDESVLIRDDAGKPLFLQGVMTDITERKELEERFLQAQKMEAVGRLAGGVAHDFNNLLTAIIGNASLLLVKLKASDACYEPVRTILETGERGARLTRQLLAFSRKEVIRPEVLNLNEVIRGMKKMVGRLIGEDIHFRFLLDPGVAAVKADPGQIEQVVLNLVVNARDAMTKGGELYISTDNVSLGEEDCLMRSGATPGEFVRLVVSDTGPGIRPEVMEHIFEPFYTTRPEGTGLGLSTVYGIVRGLGGHITVDTRLERGTAFEIHIPATRSRDGEGAVKAMPPDHETKMFMPKGRETILVTEDEPGIRGMISNVLSDLGYTVISSASAEDAQEKTAACNTPVDLLLTDIVLPGKRGTDLALEMKRSFPDLQVIFMSGYTEGWIKESEIRNGEAHFLPKPFSLVKLARLVRDVLDGPVRI